MIGPFIPILQNLKKLTVLDVSNKELNDHGESNNLLKEEDIELLYMSLPGVKIIQNKK